MKLSLRTTVDDVSVLWLPQIEYPKDSCIVESFECNEAQINKLVSITDHKLYTSTFIIPLLMIAH